MRYPGGKNQTGVYHKIINQIPRHDVRIEGFFGSGAIMRLMRPAPILNIAIDLDRELIEDVININAGDWSIPNFHAFAYDFLHWAKDHSLADWLRDSRTFLYLDPPYLRKTRRQQAPIYKHEFWTVQEHTELLKLANRLPCYVMISACPNTLYDRLLRNWRRVDYSALTRGGPTIESMYMNYDPPDRLHDYRYIGSGYRVRQDIRRKQRRWLERLASLPAHERVAMMEVIESVFTIDDNGNSADGGSEKCPRRPTLL
jgi:DNA adenine methylase